MNQTILVFNEINRSEIIKNEKYLIIISPIPRSNFEFQELLDKFIDYRLENDFKIENDVLSIVDKIKSIYIEKKQPLNIYIIYPFMKLDENSIYLVLSDFLRTQFNDTVNDTVNKLNLDNKFKSSETYLIPYKNYDLINSQFQDSTAYMISLARSDNKKLEHVDGSKQMKLSGFIIKNNQIQSTPVILTCKLDSNGNYKCYSMKILDGLNKLRKFNGKELEKTNSYQNSYKLDDVEFILYKTPISNIQNKYIPIIISVCLFIILIIIIVVIVSIKKSKDSKQSFLDKSNGNK